MYLLDLESYYERHKKRNWTIPLIGSLRRYVSRDFLHQSPTYISLLCYYPSLNLLIAVQHLWKSKWTQVLKLQLTHIQELFRTRSVVTRSWWMHWFYSNDTTNSNYTDQSTCMNTSIRTSEMWMSISWRQPIYRCIEILRCI